MAIDNDLAEGFLQHNKLTREFGTHTSGGRVQGAPNAQRQDRKGSEERAPDLFRSHVSHPIFLSAAITIGIYGIDEQRPAA